MGPSTMDKLQLALTREAERFGLVCECPFAMRLPDDTTILAAARISNPRTGIVMHVFNDKTKPEVSLPQLASVNFSFLSAPESLGDYSDCHDLFADWGLLNE